MLIEMPAEFSTFFQAHREYISQPRCFHCRQIKPETGGIHYRLIKNINFTVFKCKECCDV